MSELAEKLVLNASADTIYVYLYLASFNITFTWLRYKQYTATHKSYENPSTAHTGKFDPDNRLV